MAAEGSGWSVGGRWRALLGKGVLVETRVETWSDRAGGSIEDCGGGVVGEGGVAWRARKEEVEGGGSAVRAYSTAVIAKLAAAAVGDLADFMTIDRVTCVSER